MSKASKKDDLDLTPAQVAAVMAELAESKAELAKLKSEAESGVTLKTTQYGALQILGIRGGYLGFYSDEWERILGLGDRIRAWCEDHDEILTKAESYAKTPAEARKK